MTYASPNLAARLVEPHSSGSAHGGVRKANGSPDSFALVAPMDGSPIQLRQKFSAASGVCATGNGRRRCGVGLTMGSNIKGVLGVKLTPGKEVISPERPRGKALRNRAREIFAPYSDDWLADKADTSRNTAKCWKSGDALPSLENAGRLAEAVPEFWDLLCELSGRGLDGVRRGDAEFHQHNAAINQAVDEAVKRELRKRGYT